VGLSIGVAVCKSEKRTTRTHGTLKVNKKGATLYARWLGWMQQKSGDEKQREQHISMFSVQLLHNEEQKYLCLAFVGLCCFCRHLSLGSRTEDEIIIMNGFSSSHGSQGQDI